MGKKILFGLSGTVFGFLLGYLVIFHTTWLPILNKKVFLPPRQVMGFLPYWLLGKANADYSAFTILTYFGLTVSSDGSIEKYINPHESEPGWYALESGKLAPFLEKFNGKKKSLLVFSGNEDTISQLIDKPQEHAKRLISEVVPVMKKYGFTDLNLDVESVKEASRDARLSFTTFARTIKEGLKDKEYTLTVDVSPSVFIKPYLIDPVSVSQIADYILIMGYDYHYGGSIVTGPVAPLMGAGVTYEFDTDAAVNKAIAIMPSEKIILGLPLYGYEWETLDPTPRSAVIPGSGLVISNRRSEEFLQSCASCSAKLDAQADEQYVVYKDQETGTYHQMFFPDKKATLAKVHYAKNKELRGLAFWALGYEGNNILSALINYNSPLLLGD